MKLRRPQSLEEVAQRALRDPSDFHDALRDFVLAFSRMEEPAKRQALAAEPCLLGGDGVADAYLAAAAEMLALREGLDRPLWVSAPTRFLAKAWYAGGMERLKPILCAESPAAFRIRNLFVSADALDRPGYSLAMNRVAE